MPRAHCKRKSKMNNDDNVSFSEISTAIVICSEKNNTLDNGCEIIIINMFKENKENMNKCPNRDCENINNS